MSSKNTGVSILTSSFMGILGGFSYFVFHSEYSIMISIGFFASIFIAALADMTINRVHLCDRCGKVLTPKPISFKPHVCKSKKTILKLKYENKH